MANKILVFIEQRNGEIKKAAFEAAKTAADMGSKLGYDVSAVVIGNEISNLESLGGYGVKNVIHLKNADLTNYSSSAYPELLAKEFNDSERSTTELFLIGS